MTEALLFGVIGSSALVFGGALGAKWAAPPRVSGVALAFASGTLLSALAFELFPEAVHLGGPAPAAWGLLLGGATFVIINTWVDSRVARRTGDPDEVPADESTSEEIRGAEADQTDKVQEASSNVGPGVA
ncbi:MAG: zinc permease, partial [Actinomycetota bacterium]|nr:zinc permease [Actinomycetota bacterium]